MPGTSSKGVSASLARTVAVGLLCGFIQVALGQNQSSDGVPTQSGTAVAPIRAESKLVVVRTTVLDKRHLDKGMTQSEKRCAVSDIETFFKLAPNEPYLPKDCEALDVRDLTADDFHLLVDGKEQKIQGITTEGEFTLVRDNVGFHSEFSETPSAIWGTKDRQSDQLHVTPESSPLRVYDIAFVPYDSDPAACHNIMVKVNRQHSVVRARTEYCASGSPFDTLGGTKLGNLMEQHLKGDENESIDLSLQTGSFPIDRHKGRVQVVLEFSPGALHSQWERDWSLHATIGVLGILYRENGELALRFSDLGCCSPTSTSGINVSFQGARKLNFDALSHLDTEFGLPYNPVSTYLSRVANVFLPARYETQLELAPGHYDLRVVLSDGEKFGHARAHLNVRGCDGKSLELSTVMLCKRFRDAHVAAVETATANMAPRYVPLVSKGIRVTPTGDTNFKSGETLIPYFEICAPRSAGDPAAQGQVHLRVVDEKDGAVVKDFPPVDAVPYGQPDSTAIPIAREVPIATLPKGQYRLEVQASDSAGRTTPWRAANFTISTRGLKDEK